MAHKQRGVRAVVGLVPDRESADHVVQALEHAGFQRESLSFLFPDKSGTRDFAHEAHTKAPEGAITGVGAGGVIGGALGLLAGIGAIAIPGIGIFVAAGPIMSLLSGVATGAAIGGITGALVGLGIPEWEAKQYAGKIRDGNILLSVHCDEREEARRARHILEGCGVHDVYIAGEARPDEAEDQSGATLT